jgi:heat shock protein HslJ
MISVHRSLVLSLLPALVMACARRPSGDDATVSDTLRAAGTVASLELVNTYWKLMELDGKPVTVTDNQREPYIVLQADPKQVNGSGGCNRLFGSYETSGSTLTFGGVGSTKMACPSGMDTEVAFLPALGRVARWRITGQQLELSDSTGTPLARFEARAMK